MRFASRSQIAAGYAAALVLAAAPRSGHAQAPTVYRVTPDTFWNTLDHRHPVVRRIKPGDVVVTKTLDASGYDEHEKQRAASSNPMVGPFYVEGAEPGDALVIHFRKIRLNRTTGYSSYRLGTFALTPDAVEHLYPNSYKPDLVRPGRANLLWWDLDTAKATVRLREPKSDAIKLEFPAVPMLGVVGVAPAGDFVPTSGPSREYGGNMDFNEIREGATLYLPVFHPGALLFLADGHALMADGEPTGAGIETSMDVEFSTDLKKGARLTMPRVENRDWIMAVGSQQEFVSSLDRALQLATTDMVRWLTEEYKLEPWAAHQLINAVGQYAVVTVAGSMALKVPKRYLPVAQAQGGAANADTPVDEPIIGPTVTHHTARINGTDIAYTVTFNERALKDTVGTMQATMDWTAYIRDGVADRSRRPVLFAFNGGPGGSSSPLHFGPLGPRRRGRVSDGNGAPGMGDNPYSPLDIADIVFIDPVATGFSRVLPGGDGRRYWSVEGDAKAVLELIKDWVRENGRASSPLYICGESYGGFRVATMMRDVGELRIAGLILISPLLDATSSDNAPGNDEPYIFTLPTYAAAAWFHDRVDRAGRTVDQAYDEAEHFAQTEYAIALQQGTKLTESERTRIAARMSALIGVPVKTLVDANLRLSTMVFRHTLLADRQLVIGSLDSRVTGPLVPADGRGGPGGLNDPSMGGGGGRGGAAGSSGGRAAGPPNDYWRAELHVPTARTYVGLTLDVNSKWNWQTGTGTGPRFYVNPTPNIGAAMARQPDMRLLLVGGYYDLSVPFLAARYALEHGGVPLDRLIIGAFVGGHMVYDDEPNLVRFAQDIRAFLHPRTP